MAVSDDGCYANSNWTWRRIGGTGTIGIGNGRERSLDVMSNVVGVVMD